MEDERFFREYSKSLAQALIDNEENGPSRTKEELIDEAYSALCYDDPRVASDDACRALANSLTTQQKDYSRALSERLVDGVRQATLRFKPTINNNESSVNSEQQKSTSTPKSSSPSTEADNNDNRNDEDPTSSFASASLATAAGYGALAVAIFLEVPLQCCQSSKKEEVEEYLGSYRSPPKPDESNLLQELENAVEKNIQEERMSTITNQFKDNAISDDVVAADDEEDDDDDSMKEVFAAESDPDDFEFESDYNYQDDTLAAFQDAGTFDPKALSKPLTESSWTDLQRAVCDLLSELSYSKLAPLSKKEWKKQHVSASLTQLTLTLLVRQPSSSSSSTDNSSSTPLLEGHEELRHLGVQPLFVLRDRAMDGSRDYDALDDYLTTLQTMLAVDAAIHIHSPQTQDSLPSSLAPATIVGLSSLSALCNSRDYLQSSKANRQKIRQCVLENVEDLSSIVERSIPSVQDGSHADEDEYDKVPAWVRLVLTLIPTFQILTNIIQLDGTHLFDHASSSSSSTVMTSTNSISNAEAQLLLNSGFFRALVLLFTRTQESSTKTTTTTTTSAKVARMQLLRSILIMSVQSTNLLGKYAWRVPELSAILCQEEFQQTHLVDTIIWSLLGTICLASGSSSRLVLRKPGSTRCSSNIPTVDTCRASTMTRFPQLCRAVVVGLQKLRTVRQETTHPKQMEQKWKEEHQESLQEFSTLANLLVSCSSLATMFLSVVCCEESSDNRVCIQKSIEDIRTEVSSMPAAAGGGGRRRRKKEEPSSSSDKSADDDDKAGDPSSLLYVDSHEEDIASVRKSVKIMTLLLQQQQQVNGVPGQRPTTTISSKTD